MTKISTLSTLSSKLLSLLGNFSIIYVFNFLFSYLFFLTPPLLMDHVTLGSGTFQDISDVLAFTKFKMLKIPGSGDRRTCNSQKDKLLKSTRAVRPDGCSGAHSAQDDEHPTAVLAHPFSSTESSAFTRQRQKHAKSPPRKRLDQC